MSPQNKPDPPCAPSELKRFKAAGWIVLALSVLAITMAIAFGNAPRSFIDHMNLFLAPLVVAALGVGAYALKRFRRACLAWREEKQFDTSD